MRVRKSLPIVSLAWGSASRGTSAHETESALAAPQDVIEAEKDRLTESAFLGLRSRTKQQRMLRKQISTRFAREVEGGGFWNRFVDSQEWLEQEFSMPSAGPVTQKPSRRPTKRTREPSNVPENAPTDQPAIPSLAPNAPPTVRPSRTPTIPPESDFPTLAPTAPETEPPTRIQITESPTQSPSEAVTSSPTSSAPSKPPSLPPVSGAPTVAPTSGTPCSLNLTSSCLNCEGNTTINPVCQSAPSELIMLYKGGGCNQTGTNQQIPCFDFQGGPSSQKGSRGFVVVMFEDTVYHSAFVDVGSQYVIQNPSGGTLGSQQSIVVYKSADQSPSNVLQSLVFNAACTTESLQLLDQYGASQIVGFTINGETTLAFFNATVELQVSVPTGSPAARLDQLVVDSSEGSFNLSSDVAGSVVQPGRTDTTDLSLILDLTVPRNVLVLSEVTARNSDNSALNCSAQSFLSIPVGSASQIQSGSLPNASFVPNDDGPF